MKNINLLSKSYSKKLADFFHFAALDAPFQMGTKNPTATPLTIMLATERYSVVLRMRLNPFCPLAFLAGLFFHTLLIVRHQRMSMTIVSTLSAINVLAVRPRSYFDEAFLIM